MTRLVPFARTHIDAVLALDVAPGQEGRVAPNAVTIAQSIFEPGSEVFTIFDGDRPVGLLAVVDMSHPDADLDEGDDPDGLYIWRLLVDAAAQGRGHGRAAIEHAIDIARARGRAHLALSVVPHNTEALALYQRMGFSPSGRMVDGEVELIRRPA